LNKARLEEARNATRAVKWMAVGSIVVGVFFIVACAFIWGKVTGWEAILPMWESEVAALVEITKGISIIFGILGLMFLFDGGATWYYVAKIEGTLREL